MAVGSFYCYGYIIILLSDLGLSTALQQGRVVHHLLLKAYILQSVVDQKGGGCRNPTLIVRRLPGLLEAIVTAPREPRQSSAHRNLTRHEPGTNH